MTLFNLVHLPIPVPKAMKIPDAKAAVDKERDKFKTMQAWRDKQEVFLLLRTCVISEIRFGQQNPELQRARRITW